MCARVTSIYMEFTFTLDQNRNLSFHLSYFPSVFISYHRSFLFANKCLDFCFQTLSRQKILLNFKIILDNSNNLVYYTTIAFGLVAQLVRAPPCHGGGRRFESDLGRFCMIIHTVGS